MKVLVTGGGGFLGRYIVQALLERGETVRTFARKDYPELKKMGVQVLRGDIRNKEDVQKACQDMDLVFHTAALPGIQCQWTPFYETNVLGTQHVIEGCREHNISRLVYTSSPSVVFAGKSQENIDESVPYPEKWLAHYPHSKALGEQLVLEANGTPLRNGKGRLLTCSLRPHLLWGPHDQHLIPRLLDRARSGRLMRVGDGKNLVDQLYIENAAQAHLQAADALTPDSAVQGRAYFLSQGEPINCWDWINEILGFVDLEPVQRQLPFQAAWTIGAVLETVYSLLGLKGEPRMSRFLAAQLATSHYYDISAARRDFGFSPMISTHEGMQRLRDYLRLS
ncbi:MAG: NAD-dependent epimerase/dehydratase family protein [Thermoguttaceae bacterium]